jgi:glycerate dehydrogenase
MRIVILDGFVTDQGDVEVFWGGLRRLGEVVAYPRTGSADVVARCQGADVVVTNKVAIRKGELAALTHLAYVGIAATGTNVVDLDAARAAGVAVTNVPGYATEAVAELVFALVLHFSHDVAGHDASVKRGAWAASPDFAFFTRPLFELAGKTLVVVGSGAIGGAVARIAAAFGMRVLKAAVPGSQSGEARTPLVEALPLADVVTLHCPLTPATERLVNAAFLDALKPGAILVNTGRGGLVDEPALLAALAGGRLGGVGLDVLTQEPPAAGHPLLDPGAPWAARVVVTPHVGWGTVEARRRLAAEVTENVAAFARGEPRNRVV